MRPARLAPSTVVALLLAGCAAQTDTPDTSLTPGGTATATTAAPTSPAAVVAAAGGYKLTAAEEKLDCPRLTGQMKVRITSMRAAFADRTGSSASRAAQSVAAPVFGGTRRGADPDGDLAMDRAKLEAFNRRLAEKKCKTLDIDAELRGEATPTKSAPPRKQG